MYASSTKLQKYHSSLGMGILLISLVFFALGLALVLYRFFQLYLMILVQKPPVRLFHDPDVCKRILACDSIEDPENRNQISAVKARALPNKRLITAFHIDNAFTTMDDDYHRRFRNLADQKISGLSADVWKRIAKLTHELVRKETGKTDWKKFEIRLVPSVQMVSLKMSLHVLFDHDPLKLENDLISDLARNINELWVKSKQCFISRKNIRSLQHAIHKVLATIFPDQKFTSRETPMNLILPAYETLWRVVLRCFLEVTFRNSMASTWQSVLAAFLAEPTYAQFRIVHSSEAKAVSVSFIVFEALRLYPPTRRVYRTFQMAEGSEETVAADIEHCQRNPRIWGKDSLKFVPARWKNLSEEARRAFMPFGGRPFICPAKQDFGPMMIGILVAAFTDCVTTEDWTPESDAEWESIYLERPLISEREAYYSLCLLCDSTCS